MNTELLKAQAEVRRVKALVESGALPRRRLEEAQQAVDDSEDDVILAATLYGGARVQNLSTNEAAEMVAAAQRRFDRQQKMVDSRMELVKGGIVARGEIQPALDELEMRRRTLQLAQGRSKLVDDLLQMAETEKSVELSRAADLRSKGVLLHYEGSVPFQIGVMTSLRNAFFSRFHQELPVSAWGQTLVHQQLGFDHRGRVDIAVNPDLPEGLWLRKWLERKQISYIGFRAALSQSATGPHIHIGSGSQRVKNAPPPDRVPVNTNEKPVAEPMDRRSLLH